MKSWRINHSFDIGIQVRINKDLQFSNDPLFDRNFQSATLAKGTIGKILNWSGTLNYSYDVEINEDKYLILEDINKLID